MPGEREARADALLSAALDLPEEERARYLERECAGDQELLELVRELLADAESSDDFLEPGKLQRGELWGDASIQIGRLPPGTPVGAWSLLRELGGGGMGVVYLAERTSGEFHQKAAVKLIRAGIDTEETIRRFQQERQILASLDHPSIARLLDGGVTSEGRPFLAMEYVEGQPIDEWCNRQRLTVADRLRLFVEVGHAVEFAHRHLVVHRDLKPSNILVTDGGKVKLLDFGIAKLLDPAATPHAAPATRTAVRVMTPQYAAPEQVAGAPATTATDVYQLGLLLYELLTGRRAQEFRDMTPSEIQEVVCERIPARPSTAVTGEGADETHGAAPDRVRRLLRGDLDNIVMKALRKEVESRYASVSDLVDDIERHLAGLPVNARPATFRYLAGRFVRRNRVAVVAGSLVVISVLAGLVSSLWLARVASLERDRARREAATARRVSEFLIDTFQLADPGEARGTTVTAVELLDSGTRRIEALAGEPEIQATMKDVMGRVYLSLGLYDPAGRLLGDALELRRTLYPDPSEPVAESLDHVGRALHEQGSYDEAEQQLQRSLEMRRELFGPSHPQVAESLRGLALVQQFRRNLDQAQALYDEALAILQEVYGPRHPEVALVLKDLGSLELQRGEYERASELLRRALEIQREEIGGDHPAIADTLNALAMSLHNQDDFQEAERLYRESLEMRERILGPQHPHTASVRGNLAALFYQQREFEKAEPIFRETLELQRVSLGDDHPSVALSMTNLAVLLSALGRLEEAEPLYRGALAIRLRAYGEGHFSVATSRYYLGRLLWQRGQVEEAESLMRAAMRNLPEKGPNRASLLVDLGEMLLDERRMDEAGRTLDDAVELATEVHGADYWRTAAARSARGAWYLARGDDARAREDLEGAWTVLRERPEDDPRRRATLERLAALHDAMGEPEQATRYRELLRASRP
ncbi:MAG: tetratricopeptide repeat protein [Acidobacteriota bacterium]|jgi:serine/threonine-protein kinase